MDADPRDPVLGQLGEATDAGRRAHAPRATRLRWSVPPPSTARRQAASRAGRSKNEPSAIAASMRGRSCRTGRPAPRLRCPTSELPIWPGGRPTSPSEAPSVEWGQRASSPRHVGMGAAAIASAAGSRPMPNPSRTTRTIGRGRPSGATVTPRRGVRGRSDRRGRRSPPSRRAGARRRRRVRRRSRAGEELPCWRT